MGMLSIVNARVLTLNPNAHGRGSAQGDGARRGAAMSDLGVIENGHVCMRDGVITRVAAGQPSNLEGEVIDADGRVCMPALIDCHTHLCFAGDRWNEWGQLRSGVHYESILAAGGGIMSTVRATRQATADALTRELGERLRSCARLGVGSVEVKSGYGLDWPSEIKMLSAIASAKKQAPVRVVSTCLGAHAIPKDNPDWPTQFAQGIEELARKFPGVAVDAFCEKTALSADQCRGIFTEAKKFGLPLRLHTDQFNSIGGVSMAVELGASTVDHLEAADGESIAALAKSKTIAVLLPCSAYALEGPYARGRAMIDQGAAVAVASNSNPGSAPTIDLRFAMHLAVRHCGLSANEALTAATWNAACALGIEKQVGCLRVGLRADAIVLQERDERALTLGFAGPPPRHVALGGKLVHGLD